ncbi:MAG TPA: hypothetical protein PKW42_02120, partial [bacterium]|nr:hypothetical protein [bacterium]
MSEAVLATLLFIFCLNFSPLTPQKERGVRTERMRRQKLQDKTKSGSGRYLSRAKWLLINRDRLPYSPVS